MIRFYGFNKPAIGRSGRRVCWRENDAGEFCELADNLIAFDWGIVPGGKLPRSGSNELAKGLCLAALPNEASRAKAVYMRFRQRYVDAFPDNWSVTEADIKRAIVAIEDDGEETRRNQRWDRVAAPPPMSDSGPGIVWDTDLDGQMIVPKDPEDFAWQPAPLRRA